MIEFIAGVLVGSIAMLATVIGYACIRAGALSDPDRWDGE